MRDISVDLAAHFGLKTTSFCWLLKITPTRGAPEGYTSLDRDLTISGVTYRSKSGAMPSSIPARLRLPVTAVDARLLFEVGGFDRQRVELGHYDNARYQFSAVNFRGTLTDQTILMAGQLGKADLDDYSANFELLPWAAIAARPQGRETSPLCDCARFGRGRCQNVVLFDGPTIDDHTDWNCAVTAVTSATQFIVSGVNLAAWDDPRFLGVIRAASGENFDDTSFTGVEEVVKSYNAATGEVVLRLPLPYVPQVGDLFHCERGCDRSWATCLVQPNAIGIGNKANFRGFPFVLLDKAFAKNEGASE
jgi:uncharacterized phage protein (TIGR02218 family)